MSSAGCHYGAVEDGRRGAAPDAVALMGSLEVVELHEPVKASIERGPAGEVVPAKDHAPVGDGGTQMPSPKLVQGPTGEVIQFPAGMSDEPGRIAERIGSQAQTALQTAQLIASPSGAEEATKPPPIRVALPPVAGGPGTTYALGLPGHRCGAGPTEGHARRERCHGGTGRASVSATSAVVSSIDAPVPLADAVEFPGPETPLSPERGRRPALRTVRVASCLVWKMEWRSSGAAVTL
jgi:hypothetical protein